MKRKSLLSLLTVLLILAACSTDVENDSKSSIIGVWEYVEDDALNQIRGMSFFTEDHFAFVVNYESDSSLEVLAHSGTYILEDSIVSAKVNYSHNPSLIGQTLRWIHNTDGEYASYEILNQDNEIVGKGRVRKLE